MPLLRGVVLHDVTTVQAHTHHKTATRATRCSPPVCKLPRFPRFPAGQGLYRGRPPQLPRHPAQGAAQDGRDRLLVPPHKEGTRADARNGCFRQYGVQYAVLLLTRERERWHTHVHEHTPTHLRSYADIGYGRLHLQLKLQDYQPASRTNSITSGSHQPASARASSVSTGMSQRARTWRWQCRSCASRSRVSAFAAVAPTRRRCSCWSTAL